MSKIPATIETKFADPTAVLERLYLPLVECLNLTPEQTEKFYQVLRHNRMNGIAERVDLLRHGDTKRLTKIVMDAQKEMEDSLQALLGSANFAQYQEYQAGIGDRSTLQLMKSDFGRNPMSQEQQQLLLKAMESGRKAFGGEIRFSIGDTSDVMQEKLNRQESIDQHILQEAANFLFPAQLQILRTAQSRMLAFRREGYVKTQEMFGDPGKSV